MFKIYGGAEVFHQWAMDYALTNEHMAAGDRVSFRTATGNQHVMYAYDEGGTVMVNVPNRLLQQDKRIIVNLAGHPGCQTIFDIIPGEKTDGYDDLFTEADKHDPKDLESRVEALEQNPGGGGSGGSGGTDLCIATFTVNIASSFNGNPSVNNITCDKTDAELLEAYESGTLIAYVIDESLGGFRSSATIRKSDGGSDWMCWYMAIEYSAPNFNRWYHRCVHKAIDCPQNEFMGEDYCTQIIFENDTANKHLSITMGNQTFKIAAAT